MKQAVLMVTHVAAISLASTDYTNENGFYFFTTGGGNVKFCALNDADANAVTLTLSAQETFQIPILCRKIFKTGTNATGIYIGTGPSI